MSHMAGINVGNNGWRKLSLRNVSLIQTEELNPEWTGTAHAGKQSSGLHADLPKHTQEGKRVLHSWFGLSMQELQRMLERMNPSYILCKDDSDMLCWH